MLTARGWSEVSSAGATEVAQTTKETHGDEFVDCSEIVHKSTAVKKPGTVAGSLNDMNHGAFFAPPLSRPV